MPSCVPPTRGVVMVGGATRMPVIRAAVGEMFGTTPLTDLDPDQVVALGAALQANLLAGNRAPGELAAAGCDPAVAGPRNHGRPGGARDSAQQHDTRGARPGIHHVQDGQTAMSIHVVQGGATW